jgi:hypothetical protein
MTDRDKTMREYLFRGKSYHNSITGDINRHDWVYGFVHERNGHWSIERKLDPNCNSGFSVIKETIGQYTGLKDKNGVRIFEGDIVQYRVFGNCLVFWNDLSAAFFIKRADDIRYPMQSMLKYTVIGNIHDNPELLKEVSK